METMIDHVLIESGAVTYRQSVGNYVHYLAAKRTVDDRAINRSVAEALRAELGSQQPSPVRILDVGAGTGTMLTRMVDWGLVQTAEYTALDRDGVALAAARRDWRAWSDSRGWGCKAQGDDALLIRGDVISISARTMRADLLTPSSDNERFDLLVGNAVLDLVHVPEALPTLWARLEPGALFWFTINFDGDTIFHPVHPLDGSVLGLYHQSMDNRISNGRPTGDSHTGRHLFAHIPASGGQIFAAGASDWVVHPVAGGYPAREAEFLHHIVDTIDAELRDNAALDRSGFAAWVATRHAQIERSRLVLIAHQLDVAGRAPC